MDKMVSKDVRDCLEVNKRYIEKKLAELDDLLEEIDYEENSKTWNESKIKQLKEEYEREMADLLDHKKIYEDMISQTENYISK